jgi:hypothetical protein
MTVNSTQRDCLHGSAVSSTQILTGAGLIAAVVVSIALFRQRTASVDLDTLAGSLQVAFLPTFMLLMLVAGVVMIANGLNAM